MYDYIKGELTELTPAGAVVEAAGVGWFLNISLRTYSEIEGRKEVRLYVHFVVREDAQIFYGFATREERDLFRQLISVSGVGGNTARMVLSSYSPAELSGIIAREDAALLKGVKGLGLKTAQKIIVELKDRMPVTAALASGPDFAGQPSVCAEAVDALGMLGFSRAASEKAVRTVCRENPSAAVEDLVRLALKRL